MKRLLLATVVFLAAVAVFARITFPPRQISLSATPPDGTIPGVFHVHSVHSDGRSTSEEIARAAARAGLKFVVITDHGDATRKPDAPAYLSGVLVLDGVEISTRGGHYIALDMPAAPYPLGGEPRDVVDDVKRLGGIGIVAHPDSPKPELRWREWAARFDGMEMVNLDTSWRIWMSPSNPSRPTLHLVNRLLSYPLRPRESIASLIQPTTLRAQWETLARSRRVMTIGGADAHARLALRSVENGDNRGTLPVPSYEATFRALSVHVAPERPLSGDARADAAMLFRAIRQGHLYTVVDGAATPPAFEFSGSNGAGTVHAGDELAASGPVTLRVRTNAPPSFTTTVWNGATVLSADHHEPEFTVQAPDGPGLYWVEIRATGQLPDVPWLTSNAIYVRGTEAEPAPVVRAPAVELQVLFDGAGSALGWRVEHDPASVAAVETSSGGSASVLRWRFGLGGGTPAGQYAALVADVPQGIGPHDRLAITARAEHPMRVSVQLRAGDERWQRSIYLDTFNQERTVYFDELSPIGAAAARPPASEARSVLFVIDLTNAKPGTSERIWITRAALLH